jgi:uncharacterized protein YbaP (TraB family)
MKLIPAVPAIAAMILALAPSASSAAPQLSSVWRVTSETNTVYVAGAVPFLRESDLPLPAPFKQAYKGSQRLIFEVDPAEAKDEREGQRSIVMGMFTEGGSIRDHLSPETYKKLGDFLSAAGAPRGGMDQLRPWFAAIMISMTEMMKEGMRPDLGVGKIIEDWAAKDGKPITGLEGMRVELELLAALPEKAHEHMLAEALEDVADLEKLSKEFERFISAWREGDVGLLEEIDAGGVTDWDELMEKKLYRERSEKWIPQLEAALAGDQPTMVVIGVAHLFGEGNVLSALEAKGYKVEPFRAKKDGRKKNGRGKNPKKPALIPVLLR